LQARGERLPIVMLQRKTEVRHGHPMVTHAPGVGGFEGFAQMQGYLVVEEVEVHPGSGAAPFAATQYAAVKGARCIQIGDVKGEMKKAVHSAGLSTPLSALGPQASVIISVMSAFAVLRHSRNLARLVLAGFLLTLTCAVAAPVVNPQSTILVCTAAGDVKLIAVGNEKSDEPPTALHYSLNCVLCLAVGAPPPQPLTNGQVRALPSRIVVAHSVDADRAHTAAPPPARGPPFFS